MDRYILDADGKPQPEPDLVAWGRWMELHDCRRVIGRTRIGDVTVSTVFLGLDHRFGGEGEPILFESMVFGGSLDGEQERYTTKADAKAGHQRLCDRVSRAVA